MAIDYGKTARELVKELGENNIINVTHCATRLRFILTDMKSVNKEKVNKIPRSYNNCGSRRTISSCYRKPCKGCI